MTQLKRTVLQAALKAAMLTTKSMNVFKPAHPTPTRIRRSANASPATNHA